MSHRQAVGHGPPHHFVFVVDEGMDRLHGDIADGDGAAFPKSIVQISRGQLGVAFEEAVDLPAALGLHTHIAGLAADIPHPLSQLFDFTILIFP
jgi:hypothetical protein